MPRTARQQSETGVYHVMMRGINHQRIFEDGEDCYYFLQCLQNAQEQYTPDGTRLPNLCTYYAWCLMSNHFHLLIHSKGEPVGDTIKRIASSYVYYFNHKYGRDGHLFKERFRSEPCEDWGYFVTLLRYIHQNPVKAGIVKDAIDYEFSSWREYTDYAYFFPLCNVNIVLNRITLPELTDLVNTPLKSDVGCIDYEGEKAKGPSDDQLLYFLKDRYQIEDGHQLQKMDKSDRTPVLVVLLQLGGSIRQIQRLTGVGRNIIWKLSGTLSKT